eukprot:6465620-Amphidinium_carterae.1
MERGGLLHNFLSSLATRVSDQALWRDCNHDEATALNIMRFHLREAAVCHELMVVRTQAFPAKLFKVLVDPLAATEVLQVNEHSPCLLDPFSRDHLQRFPTLAALQSQDSKMALTATAMELVGNIFSTESSHSKATRRSKNRSTHRLSLPDLACWLQVDVALPFLQDHIDLRDLDCQGHDPIRPTPTALHRKQV